MGAGFFVMFTKSLEILDYSFGRIVSINLLLSLCASSTTKSHETFSPNLAPLLPGNLC